MLGALLMTTAAGLSTGIGGLVVLLCKRPTERMLAFSLGFAGGVMITVSLSDMLPHAVSGYLEVMERPQAAGAALRAGGGRLFRCLAGSSFLCHRVSS